jgi:hypothetical protein
VEHLLAEVGRVALRDVLQVAGAVHEHHDRIFFTRLQLAGRYSLDQTGSAPCVDGHGHELRLDPLARLEFGVRVSVSLTASPPCDGTVASCAGR